MRIFKLLCVLVLGLTSINVNAQKKASKARANDGSSKFSFSLGAGIANYTGDLIESKKIYSQPNGAVSIGTLYAITSKLNARLDFGILKVQAADNKNNSAALKARNLSFQSNVYDLSLALEYSILNANKYKITPYVSAGVGVMAFTPYANTPITGKRQSLSNMGTEGQGLGGYPGYYNTSAIIVPLGLGLKYRINENVTAALDFNYRFTTTDYLDDVSTRYPNKILLDARDLTTAQFTYRGGGSYPATNVQRGNPDKNDGYYTTQLKFAFKL